MKSGSKKEEKDEYFHKLDRLSRSDRQKKKEINKREKDDYREWKRN
jgi:hypothetical protein